MYNFLCVTELSRRTLSVFIYYLSPFKIQQGTGLQNCIRNPTCKNNKKNTYFDIVLYRIESLITYDIKAEFIVKKGKTPLRSLCHNSLEAI